MIAIVLIGILYGISTIFSGNIVFAVCSIVVGAAVLVVFVMRQGKLAEPLIDLRPLKIPPFAVDVVVNMLSLIIIFAMNIIVPTFMQSALGTPPLVASLILFPAILCSCVISPLAGRIYDKQGPGILLPLGFLCIAVFSVLTAAFIATANPVLLAIIYIPVICGSTLIIGPVQSYALSKLSPEMNPHGVTVMSSGFQIAGCIGSSVFVGVYAAVGASQAASGASAIDAMSAGMLASGVLIGVVALIGFGLALRIRSNAKKPVSVAPQAQEGAWAGKTQAATATTAAATAGADAAIAAGVTTSANVLAQIMKTDVYTLPEDSTVLDAMKLFMERSISGVPVVDNKLQVVGFISDGDVMACLADQVPAFKSAWSFIVERENEDFDRTLKETMNVNDDLGEVTRVLSENHLKKAPVLDGNRMVGIINRSNITKYAIDHSLAQKE